MEERPPIWRVAADILNKQSRKADKGWSFSLGGFGEVLTNPHRKNVHDAKQSKSIMAGTCECGNEPSGSIKCEEFLD
jgi:hypothetical protein